MFFSKEIRYPFLHFTKQKYENVEHYAGSNDSVEVVVLHDKGTCIRLQFPRVHQAVVGQEVNVSACSQNTERAFIKLWLLA